MTYSSYDEIRDRMALRQAITLQSRTPGYHRHAALSSIVARGREAQERLIAHGKLNTRYGAML
jgi:hypothetical protein